MRHYLFFALPILAASALAWIGVLPPGDWTEVVKWSVIVGACTMLGVGFSQGFGQGFALRCGQPPLTTPQGCLPLGFPDTETGTGMSPGGIFAGGFGFAGSAPIGSDVPYNYTSLERDPGAPPATTVGPAGQTVTVPVAADPDIEFEIGELMLGVGANSPTPQQCMPHSGDITVTRPNPKPPV